MADADMPDISRSVAASRLRRGELALLGGLVALGTLAGAVVGISAPKQYEARMRAQIDHVLPFPSWEANQEVARFAQALRSSESSRAVAQKVGVGEDALTDVSTSTDSNSSLVEVRFVSEDPAKADAMMTTLVDETLRRLSASDAVPKQAVVDELQPQLTQIDAQVQALTTKAGAAPGTNIVELYNRNSFDLDTAKAEQKFANEKWRIDQLQAIVTTLQPRVDAMKPLLDQWNTLNTQRDDINVRLRAAQQDLQQIQIGKRVLDSGGYRTGVDVVQVSRRRTVGRDVAAGAAVGIALALVAYLVLLVRSRRKPTR